MSEDSNYSKPKVGTRLKSLLRPEHRNTTIIALALLIGGISLAFFFSNLSKDNQVSGEVHLKNAPVTSGKLDVNDTKSEYYKEAVRIANEKKYEQARLDKNGVSMPFVFPKESNIPDQSNGNIETCGCKIDDDELLDAIRRVGAGIFSGKINPKRIGISDIFVSEMGQLYTDNHESILWDGVVTYMDSKGQLVDKNGQPLENESDSIFLSKQGQLLNSKAAKLKLKGRLVTESGIIFDSEGKVMRVGFTLKQVNQCDIYKTIDGQLATVDGRGIKSQGLDVFIKFDDALINRGGRTVSYNNTNLHLNPYGIFTNADNEPVKGKALLYSYDGIVIDSSCKLQGQLKNMRRVGLSSIYKSVNGDLFDKDGKPYLYKGKPVRVDSQNRLINQEGNLILDEDGNPIYLSEKGELVNSKGEMIKGMAILTSSNGQLLRNNGILLNPGEGVTQYGDSDIYRLDNGQLVNANGQPLLHNGLKVRVAADGSLIDENGIPVLDSKGRKIYLNDKGELVDKDGKLINESGILTSFDKVALSGAGKLLNPASAKHLVTDKSGKAILHKGRAVYRLADGRLVHADGSPVLIKDGRPVYMDDKGRMVDENGNFITENLLNKINVDSQGRVLGADGESIRLKDGREVYLDKAGNLVDSNGRLLTDAEINEISNKLSSNFSKSGDLTTKRLDGVKSFVNSDIQLTADGLLIDKDGKPLLYNGKQVRIGADGQLFDINGNSVLDANGNAVYMNEYGELVDETGKQLTDSAILTNHAGVLIDSKGKLLSTADINRVGESDIYKTNDGILVNQDGQALLHNGKRVKVGKNGVLYTLDGRRVRDSKGRTVYLGKNGDFVTKEGKQITEVGLIETQEGILFGADGQLLSRGGKLTQIGDTNLYRAADGSIVNKQGRRVLIDGQIATIDSNGRLLNRYRRPITINGRDAYLDSDGRIIDKQGTPLVTKDGRSMYLSDAGNIVDEKGNRLSSSNNSLTGYTPEVTREPIRMNVKSKKKSSTRNTQTSSSHSNVDNTQEYPDEINSYLVDRKDKESIARLQERFDTIKENMSRVFKGASSAQSRTRTMDIVQIGGNRDSGLSNEEKAILKAKRDANVEYQLSGLETSGVGRDDKPLSDGKNVLGYKGDFLFATIKNNINSDYPGAVKIVYSGGEMDGAVSVGAFKLYNDKVVIEFTDATLPDGRKVAMKGVAIDPSTDLPALASDVDHHYIYRYGGLFVAKVFEAAGIAVQESTSRVEEQNSTGETRKYDGLDESQQVVRAAGEVGAAFAEEFKDNVNRPITVSVYKNIDIVVMLLDEATTERIVNDEKTVAIPVE